MRISRMHSPTPADKLLADKPLIHQYNETFTLTATRGKHAFMGPVILAFLIVTVLAIAFGLFLAHGLAKKKATVYIPIPSVSKETSQDFEQELKKYIGGNSLKANVLTKKISSFVNTEVEKKILEKTTEISEHFKHLIEEKDKSIYFVEKQFKTISERYQKLDTSFKAWHNPL